jgi:uncharacterized protein
MILRGHHLLCVQGFRGMGYSDDFVKRMKEIVTDIRDDEQDFSIRVIAGLDNACSACPHHGETICEAGAGSNEHVLTMDNKVIKHLDLKESGSYQKSELLPLVAEKVDPDDLDYLCQGCSWLHYGVCKEGIAELKKKYRDA